MQNKEIQKTLLNNINQLMHSHNVSMRQLSCDIGCSDSYIQKLMAEEMDPSLDTLIHISQRFQVPLSSLFEKDVLRSAMHREVDTYLFSFSDKELDAVLTLSKSIASRNKIS